MVRNVLVRAIVAVAWAIALLVPSRPAKTLNLASSALATRVPVRVRHRRLMLLPRTRRSSYILRPQRYEPDMLDFLDSLPGGACFWDIGANVGLFSMYAALTDGVRVLAFEPSAASFAALTRHIEINGMHAQISAYPLAFSAKTELNTLNMANSEEGSSFNQFGAEADQFDRPLSVTFRQAAIGFSVDDFVAAFHPPAPTHVKIDVDGLEADILQGGRRTFTAATVQSMIVEVEDDLNPPAQIDRILAQMKEFGFAPRPKASGRFRNMVFDRR